MEWSEAFALVGGAAIYCVIIGILATAIVPNGIKSGRWWIVVLSLEALVFTIRHMG